MKKATEALVRERYTNLFLNFLREQGEDVDFVTTNTLNFPILEGEEEGWVEVTAKVVRYTDDEGYEKRNDFTAKVAEKAEKAEKAKQAKEAKVAKDKAEREKKKAEKSAE